MRYIYKILVLVWMSITAGISAQPVIVGDLMGQLGNQMFQIATTTCLALENGAIPLFPSLISETDFNIPLNYEKVFYHLNASLPEEPIQYYHIEPQFCYSPITYQPNMAIRGWFQSDKYFRHRREDILALFAPHPEIIEYLNHKYSFIIQHPHTVSIHYRSYNKEDPEHIVYAKCRMEYYIEAINQFPKETLFVVFSNDIEWCKTNFSNIPRNFFFIEGEAHYHDLYLMSLCKDNIICNSSFSWWGAYLNTNEKKRVIAPKNWFNPIYCSNTKDLIPEEWNLL